MKAFIAVLAMSFSIYAWAEDSKISPLENDQEKLCKEMSEISQKIMDHRQHGVAMSEMMKVAQVSQSPWFQKTVRELVVEAYKQPRFTTDELRQTAIQEFRDGFYLGCIQGISKSP
jgi:hypothetical protein